MEKIINVPNWIMRDIRENMYLEPDDTSKDEDILELDGEDFLNKWLEWNGICGYTKDIIEVIYHAFGVDLNQSPVFTRVKDE